MNCKSPPAPEITEKCPVSPHHFLFVVLELAIESREHSGDCVSQLIRQKPAVPHTPMWHNKGGQTFTLFLSVGRFSSRQELLLIVALDLLCAVCQLARNKKESKVEDFLFQASSIEMSLCLHWIFEDEL